MCILQNILEIIPGATTIFISIKNPTYCSIWEKQNTRVCVNEKFSATAKKTK
jgi:hypothetical protein